MKVSVGMSTYNHEKYIAQAIESVLMQKTNFLFELIIGEDCSTDNTRAIVQQYHRQYPDIVKPIYYERNVGMQANSFTILSKCNGKYIAALEGDDYWTDEYKLQKQVDFLEKNEDYSLCFTNIDVINEIGDHVRPPQPFLNFDKDTYTLEDIILSPLNKPLAIPTLTMVFRNILPVPLPDFFRKTVAGDSALTLLIGHCGKMKYLNEKTAAYRQHPGGMTHNKNFQLKWERSMFDLLDSFNEYSEYKYHDAMKQRLFPISKELLMYGSSLLKGKERIFHILRMLRGYNKYRDQLNFRELFYYLLVLFFPWSLKLYSRAFIKKKNDQG